MGRILIALLLAGGLSGCGGGPLGLFGRSNEVPTRAVTPEGRVVDTRGLIEEIETLSVMQTPTGAVIRATGVAPVQGFWEGELVRDEAGDPSVLTYAFRVIPPQEPAAVSTRRSREVTVATMVPNNDLAGIREIRVIGAANARAVGR